MLDRCKEASADVLVLTETDTQIHPAYKHCYQTPPAKEVHPALYKGTENRVAIYTDYEIVKQHETYDKYTAICVEMETLDKQMECIDHIAISEQFCDGANITLGEWNMDKSLSDHKRKKRDI